MTPVKLVETPWLYEGFRPPFVISLVAAQAGATQRLPACPVLPLLPKLEALMLAALREAGTILFLQDYNYTPTSTQHRSPTGDQKVKKGLQKSSYQQFQNPVDSTPGWRTSFSLTGPLIYLFKGYPSSEQGRIPFPCRSVLPSSSDLQQDSPTFPGSLHPEMLARSLFYTSQQTARSFILLRNNLTMGNKFTFSLKILLWA